MTSKKETTQPTIDPKLQKQLFKDLPASDFHLPDDAFYEEIITKSFSRCNHIIFTPPDIPKALIATGIISKAAKTGGVWYVACSTHLSLYRLYLLGSALSHIELFEMTRYSRDYEDHPVVAWSVKLLHACLADLGNCNPPSLILFDNAEYLAHPQTGPFIETCLACLPPKIPVILLASQCKNQDDLQNWLTVSRERPSEAAAPKLPVRAKVAAFISSQWQMTLLTDRKRLAGKVKRAIKTEKPFKRIGSSQFVRQLNTFLREAELTPALVVLSSAKSCDQATQFCLTTDQTQGDMLTQPQIAALLSRHPFLKDDPLLTLALTRRAAPYHPGLRPYTRKLIEHLLSFGALDIIFCTPDGLEELSSGARIIVLCSDRASFKEPPADPINAWQIDHIKLLLERQEGSQPGCFSVAHDADTDWVALKDLFLEERHALQSAFDCNFQSALAMAANYRDPNMLLDHTLFAHQNSFFGEFCLQALKDELDDFLPQASCSGHIHSIIALMDLRLTLSVNLNKLRQPSSKPDAEANSAKIEAIQKTIEATPCEGCEHFTLCDKKGNRKFRTLIETYHAMQPQLKTSACALKWKQAHHFDIMKAFEWVDAVGNLTSLGVIALRSGLSLPHNLTACLMDEDLWPNDENGYTAMMAGFVENPCLADFHHGESLARERESLTEYYEAFKPLLSQAQKLALHYGLFLPPFQLHQAEMMLAYRRGFDVEVLANQTGVSPGAIMDMILYTNYLIEQIQNPI